jgi:hypothetical protein
VELLAPRPTPNLENQVSDLYPPETGWPSYTPGHWVARVPRDRHFPYPLTWAPEQGYCYLQFVVWHCTTYTLCYCRHTVQCSWRWLLLSPLLKTSRVSA